MATPPNGLVPNRIRLPQTMEIECVQCKATIQVRIPKPRLANAPDVTIITFVHASLDTCPHCGIKYLFQINGINEHGQLELLWIPVEAKQDIIPGTQTNLSQALSTDEVVKKLKIN